MRGKLRDIWEARPRREWIFAGASALVVGAPTATILTWMALDPDADGTGWLQKLLVLLFAPPLALAILRLVLLGHRGKIGNALGAAAAAFGLVIMGFMGGSGLSPLLHGPRHLFLGIERGTIAELATRDAAFVELRPALVDINRIGTGVYTSTDNEGRSSSSSISVAPILTALGERDPSAMEDEVVTFFLCDDADDLRAHGRGSGTIAGRVSRAKDLAGDAIRNLGSRIVVVDKPMCVTPTRGSGTTTGVLWAIAFVLFVLVIAALGGFLLLRIVAPKVR